MAMLIGIAIAGGIAAAVPLAAQEVNPVAVANAPATDSPDDTPAAQDGGTDEGGKAVDVGGLSGRGGTALLGRSTFQEMIGTPIYSPIGSSVFTPVQRPPQSDTPR